MITEETVRQIIHKYLRGEATDRERKLLENWYYQQGRDHPMQEDDLRFLLDSDTIFEEVRRRAGLAAEGQPRRRRLWGWFPYAAALFILPLSITWIFYANRAVDETEVALLPPADVASGGNRATLTLADGRRINLSETQTGIVVGQGQILYEEGEQELVDLEGGEVVPLELSVPRGGTYQITLADGTKVWLNAESTLKYPSRFDGNERVVELEGEAYFSVTKTESGRWPFRVLVDGQSVEVLGTEFNVSAYPGESKKTTLVEGAVTVTNPSSGLASPISPGEQAIVNGVVLDVVTVDVYKYTAWKDGLFYFKQTPFNELIREIARWYDVQVVYEGAVPKETFSGKMRRGLSLMTALNLLDVSTKAKIRLEDRTLVIQQGLSNK
ncbi:MAG TPA: FecR domain-containing protein [Parapedobacter sp.]|uniref:FecR family protein n=1 Tax=Parapedobacter sp. TaxID=1958893 RepID=UPI002CD651C5|nr:FecR domain-containing protein [Parapedobacter sp.]HWK56813.1 FecR domain-containing protein [Parapedobacter sp.]